MIDKIQRTIWNCDKEMHKKIKLTSNCRQINKLIIFMTALADIPKVQL